MLKEFDPVADPELTTLLESGFEKTPKHKPKIQTFSYKRPTPKPGKHRAGVRLATTDILFAVVQVYEKGGEDVMHSHAGMDGFWLVLKGQARFHDGDGQVYDLKPLDGLCIPRNIKYWFERVGDEPLELLQVDSIHPNIRNTVDYGDTPAETVRAAAAGLVLYDAQT